MGIRVVRHQDVSFRYAMSDQHEPRTYKFRITCQVMDTEQGDVDLTDQDEAASLLYMTEASFLPFMLVDGFLSGAHILDEIEVKYTEEVINTSGEILDMSNLGSVAPLPPEELTP